MYYIRLPVLVIRLTQIYFMRYFLRGVDLSFVSEMLRDRGNQVGGNLSGKGLSHHSATWVPPRRILRTITYLNALP